MTSAHIVSVFTNKTFEGKNNALISRWASDSRTVSVNVAGH